MLTSVAYTVIEVSCMPVGFIYLTFSKIEQHSRLTGHTVSAEKNYRAMKVK